MQIKPFLLFPLFAACGAAIAGDAAQTAADMKALADGRRVRMAWIQDAGPTACPYSEKPTMVLMGFDTDDGLGERAILAEPSQYSKPLITDDGTRIAYGDPSKNGVFIVPDGLAPHATKVYIVEVADE